METEMWKEESFELLVEQERLLLESTELIQKLMDDEGVNRKGLAERLGKSEAHVSQIMSGERNLTLRTLAEVAFVLGHRLHIDSQELAEPMSAWHDMDEYLDRMEAED